MRDQDLGRLGDLLHQRGGNRLHPRAGGLGEADRVVAIHGLQRGSSMSA